MTTNDYKRLQVKLRITITAIGNNLKCKNVYRFLLLHNNEGDKYVEKCSKNCCGAFLVEIMSQKQSFEDVLQSKCC